MQASVPVVFVSASRTPIGRFGGGLASLSAPAMGAAAVRGALDQAGIAPDQVDTLTFGHGRQAGQRPNPARQVQFQAGIPQQATAFTVNQACASGMQAVRIAADDLRLGRARIAVAGGMESMSQVPFMLERMRDGYRLGDAKIIDGMYRDGFQCPLSDMIMGQTAELLAQERGISRHEQDAFAVASQDKAAAAIAAGRFDAEIAPVSVPGRRGETVVAADEHPRPGTSVDKLGKLPPVFDREAGTVSAGNSSGITDGAAALVMTTEAEAERLGLQPLARLLDTEVAGTDPRRMGLGPVPATQQLLQRNGWSLEDFTLFELNEAFAAQVLACLQELPIPQDLLNVNGGAIALGHPIGCTGARILVTLLHEMQRRRAPRALATLCVSGGLGMTTALELV